MKKRTALSSILLHKCPRCRQGNLFRTGIFAYRKPFLMYDRCPECGQSFYPEPGYYYGAMFTSYIITSFFSLGFVGLCILALDMSVEAAFGLLILILAVFFIWFFRLSRSAWIHITVRYDPRALDNPIQHRENGVSTGGRT